jgi:hypothetical protein
MYEPLNMNVEEVAKVSKNRKKWKNILKGGLCPDVGLYPEREMISYKRYSYVCIYV